MIGGEAQADKNDIAEAEGDDDDEDEEEEANGAPTASKRFLVFGFQEETQTKNIALKMGANDFLLVSVNNCKLAASKKKKKKKNNKKKKKVQTEPPTIPVSVLFPSKIYPEGELCEYKDE